jgi:16S rRNA U516 pseudouridylate synthase RsuA-like enzyme
VNRLIRTQYGPFELGTFKHGELNMLLLSIFSG